MAKIVPQYLHELELRKHIEAAGGKIDLGVALVGLQQVEDCVLVELSETVGGNTKTVKEKYDYVVGTDGGHSSYRSPSFVALRSLYLLAIGTVRKSVGVAFLGETHEEDRMHIVDCKVEGLEEKVIVCHFLRYM